LLVLAQRQCAGQQHEHARAEHPGAAALPRTLPQRRWPEMLDGCAAVALTETTARGERSCLLSEPAAVLVGTITELHLAANMVVTGCVHG